MLELPSEISILSEELHAPARLRKHLQIVYSTAAELLESIQKEWPEMRLNKNQVLLGAGLHDIGKAKYSNELYEAGNQHLEAGYKLLLEKGYSDDIAQIALVHEDWDNPDRSLEELLVSLSDVLWNGIRNNPLEEFVVKRIAERSQSDFWEVYMKMDPVLSKIAEGADERLGYQGS
jgi:hypothetical protein